MRLASYSMGFDVGFAPNPFWRVCTLGTCTPNHQRCNLAADDWILGNGTVAAGSLVIYAMRIDRRLTFDEYYHDPRYARKRPGCGTWRERCGDNIYRRNPRGRYAQDANAYFHTDRESRRKDLRGDRVFVGAHFFYFGEHAFEMPQRFDALLRRGRGAEYHSGSLVTSFVEWLQTEYRPGRHGLPRDRHLAGASCGQSPAV